jgi:protein-S-isoprenylcysteine O-methyltransferase Ste14
MFLAVFLMTGDAEWGFLAWQVIPKPTPALLIYAAMTVAGGAFTVWARLILGANWSGTVTLKEDHELIRTGPYRFVRHPIYTGILLALLGTALAGAEIHSLLAFAIVLVGLLFKMAQEEQILTEHFGPQYLDYRRQVKGLIPFVV